MKYILLIDEDEDILNIQQLVLSSFYGGEVVTAKDGKEGLEKIDILGDPELIVSDHKLLEEAADSLYSHLSKNDLLIPLIICSGSVEYEFKERKFPLVSAFVQKPFSIESLSYLVKSITSEPLANPSFIQVKFHTLVNFIGRSFDLYLKLSDTNFVKVVKQGDPFTKEDSEKFIQKGVTHLYVSSMDSMDFLKSYEENLNLLLSSKVEVKEKIVKTIDALEAMESVSKRLGWTPQVIEQAKTNIETAFKILSNNSQLSDILKAKLANPSSNYVRHIGLQSYMCCIMSRDLGWGEAVQTKLALAALLHDLAVDEAYYEDIKEWNKRAANLRDRTPEAIKYRLHPLEASKFLQTLENVPPDIEQIILQHHEKKDGSGFPRSLGHSRISQLAAFFIIIEELVEFIGDGFAIEASLNDFKTWGDSYYDTGHFQKIYQSIRDKIK